MIWASIIYVFSTFWPFNQPMSLLLLIVYFLLIVGLILLFPHMCCNFLLSAGHCIWENHQGCLVCFCFFQWVQVFFSERWLEWGLGHSDFIRRTNLTWDWSVVLVKLTVPLLSKRNKEIPLCLSAQPQFPPPPCRVAGLFYLVSAWAKRRSRHSHQVVLAHLAFNSSTTPKCKHYEIVQFSVFQPCLHCHFCSKIGGQGGSDCWAKQFIFVFEAL